MKKFLTFAVAILCAAAFAMAQEASEAASKNNTSPQKDTPAIGIGVRLAAGYGMIWGLEDDWAIDENDDEKPGGLDLEGGIMGRIVFTPVIHFTPELLFHYGKMKHDNDYGKQEFSFINVEIPLLVRANASPKFYAYAGVQPGFNIQNDASLKASVASKVNTGSNEQKYTKFGKSVDQAAFGFGVVAGAGYYVIDKLSLDLRVYMGLTELYPDCESNLVDLSGAKLLSFKFGANYWIF
jgi:opacity protein-like surface antigen